MYKALTDLIMVGFVSIVASVWGVVHFRLKKDEQNKLYNLRDREMRMQEEANNVKIDYLRELVTQNKLELTSDGSFKEKRSV